MKKTALLIFMMSVGGALQAGSYTEVANCTPVDKSNRFINVSVQKSSVDSQSDLLVLTESEGYVTVLSSEVTGSKHSLRVQPEATRIGAMSLGYEAKVDSLEITIDSQVYSCGISG